mgnify:CR=1 FL=1
MSKKYKFLVADDHSIVRQGVSFVLKELYQGATIIQADNFSEILKLVNLEKIDLLVLDVNFPEGSSLNVLPSIKLIQPDIKILIFSAYDEDIYAMRYINAGASGYLNKLLNRCLNKQKDNFTELQLYGYCTLRPSAAFALRHMASGY